MSFPSKSKIFNLYVSFVSERGGLGAEQKKGKGGTRKKKKGTNNYKRGIIESRVNRNSIVSV